MKTEMQLGRTGGDVGVWGGFRALRFHPPGSGGLEGFLSRLRDCSFGRRCAGALLEGRKWLDGRTAVGAFVTVIKADNLENLSYL